MPSILSKILSKKNKIIAIFAVIILCFLPTKFINAQNRINIDANSLQTQAEIIISPAVATFEQGSTFEVPIFINTKGKSINAVELNIRFDPNKLSVVKPSSGKSVIGIWVQPPTYDNTRGTANVAGVIPGGLVSNSSLIITITFLAKSTGTTEVVISDTSNVLANDGIGSSAVVKSNRGRYTIVDKPPGGVLVYSDTHSFQDRWYNNNSPVIGWNRDPGVIGYSYVLDNKPNTIPENVVTSNENQKAYTDLTDGLWYFHIKALSGINAWSSTTTFLVRIDSTPPAEFNPKINFIKTDDTETKSALITFFTTDSLSGLDHYEIGIVNTNDSKTSAPIFVQTESPYQLTLNQNDKSYVVIRAVDKAGNIIDVSAKMPKSGEFISLLRNNLLLVVVLILGLIVLLFIIHYLFGHKILKKVKLVFELLSKKKKDITPEIVEQEIEQIKEE